MIYIKDLQEGQHITQVFLCKQKETKVSKTQKNYYALKLQDKTGVLDGKVWDLNNAIGYFDANEFILVEAEITMFNGALQANIRRIRRAEPGEYDPEEYLPASDLSIEDMYKQLMEYKDKIGSPKLKQLVESFFVLDPKFIETFKNHSAAKNVHHAFIGGLLQHTLRVTQLCYVYTEQYPILNRDLLLTAAIFHDIGKTKELSPFPNNDYTDEGQLLGHIVMGYQMVKERIDKLGGLPKKQETELLHCILAHHGQLEYGSPKRPSIIEALALCHADDTDAKMEIMIEEFEHSSSNDFLGVNRFLDANIRKTSQEEQ